MEIRNCEFCNAYVANFEVHTCRNFRNQHRQCVATLPRSSFGNIAQDINLRAEQIHYEERTPSMNQRRSSWQHSIFSNIRQRTDCEETAVDEVSSQYGVSNQNPYNSEISDFLFPFIVHGEENQTESAYLLQPPEDNSALMNQNPQFCEAWNPNPSVNTPLPAAEPCSLPGFQQTFGQRNPLMNQLDQPLNTSSQMQCSGIYHMDEMPSHFVTNFNESDTASTNQLSQHNETSSGTPIFAVQTAQYNPMDPIPTTNESSPVHSKKCLKEFIPKDNLEPQNRSRGHAGPYACKYCDKTFSYSCSLTRHIRTHTGEKPYKCTVCNRCFTSSSDLTNHMRVHTGDKPYNCKQCGKYFAQSSTLCRHIRTVHTDDKPHKCTECGKCYAVRSRLKRHMLLHNKV